MIPTLQNICLFLVVFGLVITVAVLAAMPKTHATSSFVWKDFMNDTGYSSNGVAFLTGVLNGAFVVRSSKRSELSSRADTSVGFQIGTPDRHARHILYSENAG